MSGAVGETRTRTAFATTLKIACLPISPRRFGGAAWRHITSAATSISTAPTSIGTLVRTALKFIPKSGGLPEASRHFCAVLTGRLMSLCAGLQGTEGMVAAPDAGAAPLTATQERDRSERSTELAAPPRPLARKASASVHLKNSVAATAVLRDGKLALPVAPNRLPDAPLLKDAPMSAPLPCCTSTRPMIASADSTEQSRPS